jgi:hypothetical protein
MPTIAAATLQKIWQSNGATYTPAWQQALTDIRELNERALEYQSSLQEEEEAHLTTIMLLAGDVEHKTPSITLTSSTTPTLDLTTWHTIDQRTWPAEVYITLRPRLHARTHTRTDRCDMCRHAANKNRTWREIMTGVRYPMWELKGYWADREKWEKRQVELEIKAAEDEEEIERVVCGGCCQGWDGEGEGEKEGDVEWVDEGVET